MIRDEIKEAKEAGEVTVTRRAECLFCGQAVLVEHTAQITDLNELAKETCDCIRAKKYQREKDIKERIDKAMSEIEEECTESTAIMMRAAAEEVAKMQVGKITINLNAKTKYTFKLDKDDRLIIKREDKKEKTRVI